MGNEGILPKERREILRDIQVTTLTPKLAEKLMPQIIQLHRREWRRLGLCTDDNDTASRSDLFDLSETTVMTGPDAERLYAQVNTLPAEAKNLDALVSQFMTYEAVVLRSMRDAQRPWDKPERPNWRICFSITASQQHRVQLPGMGHPQSLAGHLLDSIPHEPDERMIAYSRFANIQSVGVGSLLDQYLQLSRSAHSRSSSDSEKSQAAFRLGAVGMHEYKGGVTVGIIQGARPEDDRGGRANVLVVYPRSAEERTLFAQIRERRTQKSPATHRVGHALLFDDVPL